MVPPRGRASHIYLEQLQQSSYASIGCEPPSFDAGSFCSTKQRNLQALSEGGSVDREFAEHLRTLGIDPQLRHRVLEQLRLDTQQLSQAAFESVAADYADAPTSHVHPMHHAILKRIQGWLAEADRHFPKLGIADLNRRVTVSTLPTGQVNARVLSVPKSDEYLVVFDPVYFDYVLQMAKSVAEAMARTFSENGGILNSRDHAEGLRRLLARDPSIELWFRRLIVSFLVEGRPAPFEPHAKPQFERFTHELCDEMTLFMMAHEYAHILLSHKENIPASSGLNAEPWRNFFKSVSEYEADFLACDILGAILEEAPTVPPAHRYRGVDFFMYAAMLQQLGVQILETGKPLRFYDLVPSEHPTKLVVEGRPTDHPSTLDRYGRVHGWLRMHHPPDEYSAMEGWAVLLRNVMDTLWQTAIPSLVSMHRDGKRAATVWRDLHSWGKG